VVIGKGWRQPQYQYLEIITTFGGDFESKSTIYGSILLYRFKSMSELYYSRKRESKVKT
jgi:hypothetical protein